MQTRWSDIASNIKLNTDSANKIIMDIMKDQTWFKIEIEPTLHDYDIEYRFFENGDFGTLNQVVINSTKKGGGIDFWEFGWLGIDLYDYEKEELLLNVLLEPHEYNEKEKALKKFIYLLKN
ncbi:hypothetical protein GCM10010967_53230 [Dyadobacter beijingensis]|uniref:Immunity protein 53 of polymorphic toxin system n=2 Tax=Dyadobacter beijingensis TaxID=365489 RepID=A0ABQ2IIA4_9BACT|nr:hypothetical protein GCM10010967_53230 [Dyadobacter beijingensis]